MLPEYYQGEKQYPNPQFDATDIEILLKLVIIHKHMDAQTHISPGWEWKGTLCTKMLPLFITT